MRSPREVRIRLILDRYTNEGWLYKEQPIVRLGTVGVWSMVRSATYRNAMPFVVSTKDWEKMPLAPIEAGTGETRSGSTRKGESGKKLQKSMPSGDSNV